MDCKHVILFAFICCTFATSFVDLEISKETKGGYVCAGNGFYISGQQDGTFQKHGWHIPGEMSGIWMQPIKLINSYEIETKIKKNNKDKKILWSNSQKFTQKPYGNSFYYENKREEIQYIRSEYIIDNVGVLIDNYINYDANNKNLSTIFYFYPNLRGCWLSDQIENDDIDICEWNDTNKCINCWDLSKNKFLSIGFDENNLLLSKNIHSNNKIELELKENSKSIKIFITGCKNDQNECLHKLNQLKDNSMNLLDEKIKKYENIHLKSMISIPDKDIEEMYIWSKFNIYWLFNSIDHLGSGIFGGLPEYPMFFGCDTTYSIQGLLAIGMHQGNFFFFFKLESFSSLKLYWQYFPFEF